MPSASFDRAASGRLDHERATALVQWVTLGSHRQEETHMSDGKLDQGKGRAKEPVGDLTGDKELQREGKVDQASGATKEKVGDLADSVKDALSKDR